MYRRFFSYFTFKQKTVKPIVTLSLFLLLFHHLAIGQTNDSGIAQIITNIRQLHELNPSEKCFVHTDKQFYQPGETVWFKTYLTVNDLPVVLSNVVYTDFSDANGKVYAKAMWKADKGIANGNIFIPDTLATGVYRIRSYSLWMLNEPSTINEQYIFILGKKDQSKTYHLPQSAVKVTFFPESGSLVESVENNLAFRITDVNSIPVTDVTVELTDETKKVIGKPAVFENGTGLIKFTPEPGKNYSLLVSLNLNNRQSFPLPEIKKNGITLSVSNLSASKIFIQANATEKFMDENKIISVIGQQYGKPVFTQTFNFDEAQNASIINKKTLAEGLLQVIALNSQLQPIAERWVWVEMPAATSLTITTDSLSFEPKGKNKWHLNYSGAEIPELSVSIIPADLPFYSFISHPDIRTYQLLHSNNKQPGFVQNNIRPLPAELNSLYLDALLLTIQPSRFTWQQISTGKQPDLRYFFETGISIRGTVKKEKENMQFDSSKIDIITKAADSSTIFSTAKLNSNGEFAVNDLHFRKQASIYLQATNKEKKKRSLQFELLPGYLDTLGNKIAPALLQPTFKEYTVTNNNNADFVKKYSISALGKELSEIVIKGKKTNKEDSLSQIYVTDLFRNTDFTFAPDAKFSYASIYQMLQELIPGLYVSTPGSADNAGTGTDLGLPIISFNRYTLSNDRPANGDGSANSVTPVPVAFFLNEIPIDITEVNMINPSDVILVKAHRNPNLMFGNGNIGSGAEGSIMIYTKKQDNSRQTFQSAELKGYSIPIYFNQPDFSRNELRNTEDRRTTLLWQPHVEFENGKATIRFFNNDYTKKFKVVVQGIDQKGNLYYFEKIIE